MSKTKTVALVLGSGGARGYAHIGVIEMLEEKGYEIVSISGCSMGALIGGVYAAGKLTPFKDWATGLGQFDILKLLDFSLSSPGAIKGDKGFSIVRELLGDTRIEDLRIPYTAVATDLLRHKEVWFQKGLLHQAIRASVAIPSLLSPVLKKGRLLVDGGVLNPLPILPGISSQADLLIAVNLSWEEGRDISLPEISSKEDTPTAHWKETFKEKTNALINSDTWDSVKKGAEEINRSFRTFASQYRKGTQVDVGTTTTPHPDLSSSLQTLKPLTNLAAQPFDGNGGKTEDMEKKIPFDEFEIVGKNHDFPLGKMEIMDLSIEAMQTSLTRYKLAAYPPDILINIPKHVCRSFDYHKAAELILLGRERTEDIMRQEEQK